MSGKVQLLTRVTPGDPITPADPLIPGDPVHVAVYAHIVNARGVGQLTGQSYSVKGSTELNTTSVIQSTLPVLLQYTLASNSVTYPAQSLTLSLDLTAQGQASNVTVTPSLLGWWQAEGDATDTVGRNAGAEVGSVSFVSGKVGLAFHFDGSSLVEVPSSPTLEPQAMTAMLWMRSDLPQPATYLLSKGASACNADSSYAFYTAGNLNFYVSDGVDGHFSPSPPASGIFDGNWHHLAGSYDGSTVRLYVDGVEQGSGEAAAISTLNYALANNAFRIGGYKDSCGGSFLFNGDIDEVQLFSHALSAQEIQAIYDAVP